MKLASDYSALPLLASHSVFLGNESVPGQPVCVLMMSKQIACLRSPDQEEPGPVQRSGFGTKCINGTEY